MMHPMIAGAVFNSPLMIDARKAAAFMQGLGHRIVGDHQLDGFELDGDAEKPATSPLASLLDKDLDTYLEDKPDRAYAIVDGVAVISITGVLIHRGAWIGKSSGQTSYEGIMAQLKAAAADHRVRGVALELDSYGGQVAGCFDLADQVREVAKIKPVWAFVGEHAYSAAYALASQANRIIVPRTGGVGSIGVICMHADFSKRLEEDGIKVTLIHAGAHKADANPYQKLPKAVREEMQGQMETLRDLFAETVAAGRGLSLTAEDALATEARCFMGQDAVAIGLADQVSDLVSAFNEFAADVNGRQISGMISGPLGTKSERSVKMSKTPQTPGAKAKDKSENSDATDEDDQVDDDDQPVDDDQLKGEGNDTDAGADAAVNERERVSAILQSDEAQGRKDLAEHLAFKTDMSPDAAKAALAAAPVASEGNALDSLMEGDSNDVSDTTAEGQGESLKAIMAGRYPEAK